MKRLEKLLSVLIISTLSLSFVACSEQDDSQTQTKERVEKVKTQKIEEVEISRSLTLSTVLAGYETVNVSSTVSGIIEDIAVTVGDKVKQGQLLVTMDPTQYISTQIAYANLQVEMNRLATLLESGSVAQQVYDQTKVQFDQTKKQLDLYERNTYVKAKFAGIISAKNFEEGELCAGQPILILTQIDKLKAYVEVPEKYFPLIKNGMSMTLKSEIYPEKTFPAVVELVYPTVDASSHNFTVKVRIANNNELLRPGMYVTTTLALGNEKTVVVPTQAVLKVIGANGRYVFVNNNGVAKRVPVRLGDRFNNKIEIISDEINVNDEIVVVGQGRLIDGVKLEIIQD